MGRIQNSRNFPIKYSFNSEYRKVNECEWMDFLESYLLPKTQSPWMIQCHDFFINFFFTPTVLIYMESQRKRNEIWSLFLLWGKYLYVDGYNDGITINIIDYEPTTTLNSKILTKYHTMYRPQEEILISTCNFMNILGFYQFDIF